MVLCANARDRYTHLVWCFQSTERYPFIVRPSTPQFDPSRHPYLFIIPNSLPPRRPPHPIVQHAKQGPTPPQFYYYSCFSYPIS